MIETCSTCYFWKSFDNNNYHLRDKGQCRRYPPVERSYSNCESYSNFPDTHMNAWCGEYKKKDSN
jgi:hypothetical protein